MIIYFYRELADRKSQFAQEISSALMQVEDFKRLSEDASKRAEEAEQFQKMVQVRHLGSDFPFVLLSTLFNSRTS